LSSHCHSSIYSTIRNAASHSPSSVHRKIVGGLCESLELRSPLSISLRNARTVHLRRANIPTKEKALINILSNEKYKFPMDGLSSQQTCQKVLSNSKTKQKNIHPIFPIMARNYMEAVNSAPVLIVMHKMKCKSPDLFAMRVQFKKNNMKYLQFHTDQTMYEVAFKGTPYSTLLPLFEGMSMNTVTAVSYDRDIAKILKVEKRLPYLDVLCCVMDGRILSKADMQRVADLPSMDQMRATLCHTLATHSQQLSSYLSHHQTELSSSLSRHLSSSDSKEKNSQH